MAKALEHFVADGVAVLVVDALEVVGIDHEQGKLLAGAACVRTGLRIGIFDRHIIAIVKRLKIK